MRKGEILNGNARNPTRVPNRKVIIVDSVFYEIKSIHENLRYYRRNKY
jgi:hypothetical protein